MSVENRLSEQDAAQIENVMLCARWLVHQFENINCGSVARLFQKAIDDAEAWVQTKILNGEISEQYGEPIKSREAKIIHNILIKYASIEDPEMRDAILGEMIGATKRISH